MTLTTLALALTLTKAQAAHTPEPPVPLTICRVFGARHCYDALRVSWCESRWNPRARNGQYHGIFQVSAHWRRVVPGWGSSAHDQTVHAYRVFVRTGRNWRHWECRSAIA